MKNEKLYNVGMMLLDQMKQQPKWKTESIFIFISNKLYLKTT